MVSVVREGDFPSSGSVSPLPFVVGFKSLTFAGWEEDNFGITEIKRWMNTAILMG